MFFSNYVFWKPRFINVSKSTLKVSEMKIILYNVEAYKFLLDDIYVHIYCIYIAI